MKNWLIHALGGHTTLDLEQYGHMEFVRGIHQGIDQERNPNRYSCTAMPETVIGPFTEETPKRKRPKKKKK